MQLAHRLFADRTERGGFVVDGLALPFDGVCLGLKLGKTVATLLDLLLVVAALALGGYLLGAQGLARASCSLSCSWRCCRRFNSWLWRRLVC